MSSNYTPKDNSGVLFSNKDKKNEKSPDYSGNVIINGKEFRLAGWLKDGKKGKFLSLSVSVDNKTTTAPSRTVRENDEWEL